MKQLFFFVSFQADSSLEYLDWFKSNVNDIHVAALK